MLILYYAFISKIKCSSFKFVIAIVTYLSLLLIYILIGDNLLIDYDGGFNCF